MLLRLFQAFFDICRLRKGPQDLPPSAELLALALVAYAAVVAVSALISRLPGPAIGSSMVETFLIAAINFVLLALRRFDGRWLQTTTAMAGTGVLFTLLALPLLAGLAGAGNADAAASLLYPALLALIVWNIAVIAHILRHALSVPFAVAVIIAAAYAWVIAAAVSGVFPEAA